MSIRTYVDVHILHSVPPSNLNRDDAGSPKQAVYGGVRRARVSSQAWKRATRLEFQRSLPVESLGTRTKRVSTLLASRLAERAGLAQDHAMRLANALLADLKVSAGKKESETAYLLFFGRAQVDAIVDLVAEQAGELIALDDETLAKEAGQLPVREQLMTGHPIDVALFGRMVADLPALNVDAATQVAHAISTHAADVEFDYYTAVDDEKDRKTEDAGASMIGTVEFTSATLYRFATVGMHQLLDNLGGDADAAIRALRAFVEAFVRSMPTGHENTFAHHTVPSLVSVVVRPDQPVNLVSAFERPVVSRDGLAAGSAGRLAAELLRARDGWGLAPLHVWSQFTLDEAQPTLREAFGEPVPFGQILDAVAEAVRPRLDEPATP